MGCFSPFLLGTGLLFILSHPAMGSWLFGVWLGSVGGLWCPSAGMGWRKLPQKKILSGVFGSVGGTGGEAGADLDAWVLGLRPWEMVD